jgi:serine/threonine-protein kinase RsbT
MLAPDIIEVRVHVECERGLVEARRQGRQLATRAGFALADRAIVASIVSELGRNILLFAAPGDILVKVVEENQRVGILIAARDSGPGIPDIARALGDGYSTVGRLGLGLPGVKRFADEFDIVCGPDRGTTVRVRKWRR